MFREEAIGALPGVLRVGGSIAAGVVGVFKGVTGVWVFPDVDGLAEGFHGGLEGVDVLGGDAAVLSAKVSHDGGVNLLEGGFIRGQGTVVDDNGAEAGVGYGEERSVASAHTPADGADAVGIDVFAMGEPVGGGGEVADTAILRQAAHEFVGGFSVGGDFAAIEIDGEGDVALVGEMLRLLLDPVIETPPLVNDDEARVGPVTGGQVEEAVDGFIAAGERDILPGLRVKRRGSEGEAKDSRKNGGRVFGFHAIFLRKQFRYRRKRQHEQAVTGEIAGGGTSGDSG